MAEGRGLPEDRSMVGDDLRTWGPRRHEPAVSAQYVEGLRADVHEETPRPDDFVPCTTLWHADGTEYLGRLAIRHRLTGFLLEQGGPAAGSKPRHRVGARYL